MPREIGCPEAELALLGCFLRLPAPRVLEVARRMTVTDLVDPRHRAVFAAVVIVAAHGHDPDPALVLGDLRSRGLEASFTDDRPAGAYLAEVYTAAGVPANVEAYRLVVVEHAYRRTVVEVAQRLEQHAGTFALSALRELFDDQVALVHAAGQRLQDRAAPRVQAVV